MDFDEIPDSADLSVATSYLPEPETDDALRYDHRLVDWLQEKPRLIRCLWTGLDILINRCGYLDSVYVCVYDSLIDAVILVFSWCL